ncbi:Outer membrane protein assembly factor BamE, lipoprotein component of the BamABCDE complex [Formivibrio citricus]|uniref:Outer membrane protein assembly factor BamE, lipoprotein component of the BamABCDE complex n=1 Tax=Formivibrio citricus TaxID=83765 RepID=A0A1I5CUF5_9NEIS|nr:outer membrane protein assembly factor BamE [Formivibrio citricus]SFN90574.1 Outer membrane protein assembly factor BamE, lipoprotein component of the BamABCDE complex [Formivibrio citricus]
MKRISDLARGMRPLLLGVALVMGSVAMTGCGSSSGVKVEEGDTAFIQKGKTTKAQVLAKLGEPTSRAKDSTGKETLRWDHTQTKVDPKSYIPVAGFFIGGGKSENKSLAVIFDKRGIVQDYEYTGGTVEGRLYN